MIALHCKLFRFHSLKKKMDILNEGMKYTNPNKSMKNNIITENLNIETAVNYVNVVDSNCDKTWKNYKSQYFNKIVIF